MKRLRKTIGKDANKKDTLEAIGKLVTNLKFHKTSKHKQSRYQISFLYIV